MAGEPPPFEIEMEAATIFVGLLDAENTPAVCCHQKMFANAEGAHG